MAAEAPAPGIGERLRQARTAREWSLLQVARELHIKPHYLEALERDDWDALPSPAHARGFLRTYAAFLGLDPDALLAQATPPPAAPPTPAATTPPPPSEPAEAQAIFRRLGATLREHREALGFSLADMERLTHVKAHYLAALEDGRLEALPSPVQGRGMLLHYARALHLDPEPLLLAFAEGLQARLQARATPPGGRWQRMLWRLQARQWGNVLLATAALLAMLLFLLWGTFQVLQVSARRAQTPTAARLGVSVWTPAVTTAAPVNAGLTPAVTLDLPSQVSPTPPPDETAQPADLAAAAPTATVGTAPPTAGPVTSPVHVVARVRHRAWLRVLADGDEVFRARVAPGETFTFRAEERLEVQTGDAAALELVYNQQNLGVLGRLGEPLLLIFTPDAMLTPTPLASPTPTITPTPTATPTGPTPTPAGSPTPTPTATPVLQPRP